MRVRKRPFRKPYACRFETAHTQAQPNPRARRARGRRRTLTHNAHRHVRAHESRCHPTFVVGGVQGRSRAWTGGGSGGGEPPPPPTPPPRFSSQLLGRSASGMSLRPPCGQLPPAQDGWALPTAPARRLKLAKAASLLEPAQDPLFLL